MTASRPIIVLLIIALFSLNACVAPAPRSRVVYHEGSDQGRDRGLCHRCGTIRDVYQVELRQGSSGGGALLGAIIGGVIGNSVGHGGGRAAATAIGAVGGAAIGDSVERDGGRLRSGYVWQFRVQMDDGRWASVTQRDNLDLHPGDRVFLRGDRLELLRR
ncbi:MAG: glycine zipper 2TM domain-containing protein [Rudaea sp.]